MTEQEPPRGKLRRWVRCRVFLYFVLGLGALDLAVSRQRDLWRSYDRDEYRERIQACRGQNWDLIVVGGSPVCEGINPALLAGLAWQGRRLDRIYNLGLPGGTTSEMWHAVEHGVRTPPRVLVYGITASDLNDGRFEPHGPTEIMDLRDVFAWVRTRPRAAEWCVRQYLQGRLAHVWSLYYYRNGIRLWAADRAENLWPGVCPEAAAEARDSLRFGAELRDHAGFSPRPQFRDYCFDERKAGGMVYDRFYYLEKFNLGGHLAYLHRLIDWAESRHVALVLVDMPVTADLECRVHPQAFARYRNALAEVERTRGVKVVRASREAVGLEDAHFADLIHLNLAGSTRFSRWLRDALAVQGGTP